MNQQLAKTCFLLLSLLYGAGCASTAVDDEDVIAEDPYESLNRDIYSFNRALDEATLKPIAQGYKAITPAFIRARVGNFFGNLEEPLSLVNNAVQAKPGRAGRNAGRFLVNTTVGLAGFFDIASEMGLASADEDFGQTLRKASGSSGAYIMLPLLGPSSTEDAIGTVGEIFFNGYLWRRVFDDDATENVLTAVEIVHARSKYLDFEETMDESIFDEYSFVRDAYLERRKYLTADEDQ